MANFRQDDLEMDYVSKYKELEYLIKSTELQNYFTDIVPAENIEFGDFAKAYKSLLSQFDLVASTMLYPNWDIVLKDCFSGNDAQRWLEIIKFSMKNSPFETYISMINSVGILNVYRSLHMWLENSEKEVVDFARNNSLESVLRNYSMPLSSDYAPEIAQLLIEGLMQNPNVTPESVEAYFSAIGAKFGKIIQERASKKNFDENGNFVVSKWLSRETLMDKKLHPENYPEFDNRGRKINYITGKQNNGEEKDFTDLSAQKV